MDMDTTINGLAHELWAIAQGRAAIEDVVTPMMAELHTFAAAVTAAERKRCAKLCDAACEAIWPYGDPAVLSVACANSAYAVYEKLANRIRGLET